MMKRLQSLRANPKTSASFLFSIVTLLTLSEGALAAPPAQIRQTSNRTPAAAANTAQPRAAPAQAQQQQLAAPAANEGSLRPATDSADDAGTLPERIDVQTMKRRYWTVGNEDLMDVVQNRLYTKKGRMEFAARYGFWSDDPFQDQKTVGFSAGYHLNEFFSLHAFYAKISASNNQAYERLSSLTPPIINPGKSVSGLEARASLIYGKLSLLGSKIIYYDLNAAAGLAQHKATVGSSTGYFVGLGQQFFLSRTLFLTLDYRIMFHTDKYNDTINKVTDRSLTTNWFQLGLGVFAF